VLHVKRLAVVTNNYISLINEIPCLLDAPPVTIMVVTTKHDFAVTVPLCCPRDNRTNSLNLIERDVLIEQPPTPSEVRTCLDIDDQYLYVVL
jgi:hypothetical protein